MKIFMFISGKTCAHLRESRRISSSVVLKGNIVATLEKKSLSGVGMTSDHPSPGKIFRQMGKSLHSNVLQAMEHELVYK